MCEFRKKNKFREFVIRLLSHICIFIGFFYLNLNYVLKCVKGTTYKLLLLFFFLLVNSLRGYYAKVQINM